MIVLHDEASYHDPNFIFKDGSLHRVTGWRYWWWRARQPWLSLVEVVIAIATYLLLRAIWP